MRLIYRIGESTVFCKICKNGANSPRILYWWQNKFVVCIFTNTKIMILSEFSQNWTHTSVKSSTEFAECNLFCWAKFSVGSELSISDKPLLIFSWEKTRPSNFYLKPQKNSIGLAKGDCRVYHIEFLKVESPICWEYQAVSG
jgi:hypothetical protein